MVEETDEPADQQLETGTEVEDEWSETGEFEAKAPESADEASDATKLEADDANGDEPDGDIAERIRLAAQAAAQRAEDRALDEILALEQDLERAKEEATGQLETVEGRLTEAESRASEAERRVEEAELRAARAEERLGNLEDDNTARAAAEEELIDPSEIDQRLAEAEDQGRSAAADWLREQLDAAREEADARQAEAVEAARAETEERVRAELAPKAGGGALGQTRRQSA